MGYTIYLKDLESYTGLERMHFLEEAEKVLEAFGVFRGKTVDEAWGFANEKEEALGGDVYECSASDCCAFYTGDGDLHVYGPHESFNISTSEAYSGFLFTKTNRKSYDGLIKVIYALARKHFNGILSHDGDKQDYWTECEEYYSEKDKKLIDKFKKKYNLMDVCDE